MKQVNKNNAGAINRETVSSETIVYAGQLGHIHETPPLFLCPMWTFVFAVLNAVTRADGSLDLWKKQRAVVSFATYQVANRKCRSRTL